MRFSLDEFYRDTGTRFRLFAQSPVLEGFSEPETVTVSSPAGSLGPGPSDRRMYALMPNGKKPYEGEAMPPYMGPRHPDVCPSPGGHFDHLQVDDPCFASAHMFGTVRRVLDVWETYLGGPVPWHFAATHPRLEMIAHVPWNNAHFGWGFMECGEGADDQGTKRPFALNFDVLAHETGHGLVYALVGMPTPEQMTTSYRGFHESASDCIAMISALHFDTFVDHVLRSTQGDLYAENEMNRIGELSRTRQIRIASNALTLRDVVSVDKPADKVTGKEIHTLGQPLTGAVFDIGVEFYLDRLVQFGVMPKALASGIREAARVERLDKIDRTQAVLAYASEPEAFRQALCDARDLLGMRLAETWRRLSPERFSFSILLDTLLEVDRERSGPANQQMIAECFQWRGIKANGA